MADKRVGRARQGTHPKAPQPHLLGGHRGQYTTASGQAAQKVLAQAARRGQRVDVTVIDKKGQAHAVVSNRWKGHHREPGKDAGWVKKQSGTTAGDLKGFAAQQSTAGNPAASDAWGKPISPKDIAEFQIVVYF